MEAKSKTIQLLNSPHCLLGTERCTIALFQPISDQGADYFRR